MSANAIQQDTVVTISGGKYQKPAKFETYKFWEVLGEISWRGADRFQAEDAAKWARKAEPGLERIVKANNYPDILLKVRAK